MTKTKFLTALNAAETAREAYLTRCLVVWRELQVIAPELVADILALGFDEHAAALWICQPDRDGDTPAAKVDAGHGEDVRQMIQRVMHGFCA